MNSERKNLLDAEEKPKEHDSNFILKGPPARKGRKRWQGKMKIHGKTEKEKTKTRPSRPAS